MEFLSEDLYGGQQISVTDALNDLNQFDINSIQNLQQNLDQLQFLNPGLFGDFNTGFDPSVLNGMPVSAEAILGSTASGGLMDTLQTVNDPTTLAYYQGLIDNQGIQNQVEQNIANLGDSPIDQGETGDDPLVTGGVEDNIYEMLYAVMAGRQGIPGETSPELLRELESVLAGANQDQIDTIAQEIQAAGGFDEWLAAQEEEVVDPNESTVDGDTTASGGDTEEEESWTDRLSNWWQNVLNSMGGGSSGPPTLPGSAGVIITPSTMGTPGSWRVFLPGMIPGLPSSPTIIGTIEDILSAPGDVLSDLWGQIQNRVQDPVGYLEDLLNGTLDPDGLVTVGGISAVVGAVIDDLFEGDPNNVDPTEGEQTGDGTSVGGAGDDTNVDEELNLSDSDVSNQVGGTGEVTFDNETPELGGAGVDDSVGGGGGGGRVANPESGQDYMYRLSFNPGAPMQVPGGMMMPTMPQMSKPVDSNSVLDGLLTRLIS